MKLNYIFRMSFDNALQHKGRIFLSVVLYTIAMVLIGIIVLLGSMQSRIKSNLDKALKNGLDNWGYLSLSLYNEDYEDSSYCIGDIMSELNCVDSWSTDWGLAGWDISGEWSLKYNDKEYISNNLNILKDIQQMNGYDKDYISGRNTLEKIYLTNNTWDMLDIKLYSGKKPDECDYDKDCDWLYLGYEYRDAVEPGTIITKGEETYVVAGILKKNSIMPVDEYILEEELSSETMDSTYLLNYSVLDVSFDDASEGMGSSCFFSIAEGYTFAEAEDIIIDAFSKIDGNINVVKVEKWLNSFYDKANERIYREFLIMIIIVSCLILACFQINSILSRRRDYGIFFASGLSHGDMIKMVVIENTIKLVIAVMIMLFVISLIINKELNYGFTTVYMLKQAVLGKLIVITVVVGSMLIFIESFIPAIIVKQLSPAELIGGK